MKSTTKAERLPADLQFVQIAEKSTLRLCRKTEKLLQSKLQTRTPWNETFNLGYNSHESSIKGLLCHHQHALLATPPKANLAIRLGILKTMHMPSLRHA